jgi:phosphonate transport system substrate-binding protein
LGIGGRAGPALAPLRRSRFHHALARPTGRTSFDDQFAIPAGLRAKGRAMNPAPRPAVRRCKACRPLKGAADAFCTERLSFGIPDTCTPRAPGRARDSIRSSPTSSFAMKTTLLASLALAFTTSLCAQEEAAAAKKMLRMTFIPDQNVQALEKVADKISAYLKDATGMEVKYEKAATYQACVNGLAANKLDLVWFGGVTYCQAMEKTEGKTVLVACRDIDLKFKSYFIANRALVDSGKVKKIEKLEDLKPLLSELTFTFGAKDSTSGHIMPRHFLVKAGIAPEKDMKGGPQFQLAGGHGATFKAVAGGQVDLGVLNYTVWDGQKPEDKEKAPIIYTTPEYVDYCFAAHERLGKETIDKLSKALIALDAKNPEHKEVLDAWKCKAFVAADPKQWDGMRKVLAELPMDFLK